MYLSLRDSRVKFQVGGGICSRWKDLLIWRTPREEDDKTLVESEVTETVCFAVSTLISTYWSTRGQRLG